MFSFLSSLAMDENACSERCRAVGQRFVYLDKQLLNMETLFGKMDDDHHPYIRKYVKHSLYDASENALFGHSSSIHVEMMAIGMRHNIENHVNAFIKRHCGGSEIEHFVLLVQNTGYFPIAIFFTHESMESLELNAVEARALMDSTIQSVIILNT